MGVNVANFFPQIGLTTFLGRASPELSSFTGGAGNLWDLGGTMSGPVFQGGALRAQYRAAKAKFDEAKAAYQQSVLTALQEVSNALINRQKLAEENAFDGQAAVALASSVELATQRLEALEGEVAALREQVALLLAARDASGAGAEAEVKPAKSKG